MRRLLQGLSLLGMLQPLSGAVSPLEGRIGGHSQRKWWGIVERLWTNREEGSGGGGRERKRERKREREKEREREREREREGEM